MLCLAFYGLEIFYSVFGLFLGAGPAIYHHHHDWCFSISFRMSWQRGVWSDFNYLAPQNGTERRHGRSGIWTVTLFFFFSYHIFAFLKGVVGIYSHCTVVIFLAGAMGAPGLSRSGFEGAVGKWWLELGPAGRGVVRVRRWFLPPISLEGEKIVVEVEEQRHFCVGDCE